VLICVVAVLAFARRARRGGWALRLESAHRSLGRGIWLAGWKDIAVIRLASLSVVPDLIDFPPSLPQCDGVAELVWTSARASLGVAMPVVLRVAGDGLPLARTLARK